jgi:hypothetical protein
MTFDKASMRSAALATMLGVMGAGSLQAQQRVAAEGKVPGHGLVNLAPAGQIDVELSFAWDSAYAAEGRDNLDGDSLVGTTLDTTYGGLSAGIWYASSPETEYTELDLYASYTLELYDWELAVGYTHLEFLSDDANDDEVGGSLGYGALPGGLSTHIDWYYSFDSEGSFFQAVLDTNLKYHEAIVIRPAVVLGFNSGYIPDGHDGLNNLAVSLEAAVPLKEGVKLGGYITYNWGIDSDAARYQGDELLKDFFFGGVSLACAY